MFGLFVLILGFARDVLFAYVDKHWPMVAPQCYRYGVAGRNAGDIQSAVS